MTPERSPLTWPDNYLSSNVGTARQHLAPSPCPHLPKNMLPLNFKIVLHENILPPTIPQRQDQVSKEPEMRVLYMIRRCLSFSLARKIISENDGAHRAFSSPCTPHKEHLVTESLACMMSHAFFPIEKCIQIIGMQVEGIT